MKSNTLPDAVCLGLMLIASSGWATSALAQSTAGSEKRTDAIQIDLGGGISMEFALIPAGSFRMGSDKNVGEEPVHRVTVTAPFCIGKYLVTQEQWQSVMGSNPSHFQGPKLPVDSVSWDDCQHFIAKLQEKVPGQQFCLPTEAQWEYACRAGNPGDYCYGDGDTDLRKYAWYNINADLTTHPVGEKKPNAWGLYDVHGNVWEWCQDVYHPNYQGAPTDGSAWSQGGGSNRVLRGGPWFGTAPDLRSANRYWGDAGFRNNDFGLRMSLAVTVAVAVPARTQSNAGSGDMSDATKIDLGGAVGMQFVLIRPGSFVMGSDNYRNEKPSHKVTIAAPFYIGKYLVTQEQWQQVMETNPSIFQGEKNPVENISWIDCQKFITKLNQKVPGRLFSLPTEAQWEYACRAGSSGDYDCDEDALPDYAWYRINANGSTHPVGRKKPNAWGLYDMRGNVWEWCQDVYHQDYDGAPEDGSAWTQGGEGTRVLRSGPWNGYVADLRSANRSGGNPFVRSNSFGLRVVMDRTP